MGQMYTFHKSVRGQGHINHGVPCEDSSASFTSDDGRYHIAIIADGHGQEKSFRSRTGSQAAADIALECLKGFAEATLSTPEGESRFYQDALNNPRYRQMTIRQLTNTILAGWSDHILKDYSENPPTEEEFGEYAEYYKDESRVPEIYGTTLIASLMLPKCLILIHQGDGRCDVFYSDGSVTQPIPWDVRCQGTQTTSLCDEDAADSFRHCIIDREKKPVIACYVGSDGVEDAYRDGDTQAGTHTFYRDLSCSLVEKGKADFEAYLDEMLPEFSAFGRFSKAGSMDDVSVAGIVDIDAVRELVPAFQLAVKEYSLSEDLFWKEDELRSKMRGHGILNRRMQEAQERYEQAKLALRKLETERDTMVARLGTLQDRISQSQIELEEARASNASAKIYFQSGEDSGEEKQRAIKFFRELSAFQLLFSEGDARIASMEKRHKKLLQEQDDLKKDIDDVAADIEAGAVALEGLRVAADTAKTTYEEYDAKYQAISAEIEKIKADIAFSRF